MVRLHLAVLLLLPAIYAQNTFQNTKFDLPPDLPVEDPGVSAQAEGVPLHKTKDEKPQKVNKFAPRQGDLQPPQKVASLPVAPQAPPPQPAPALPTFPGLPTLPPFTFPTFAPFVLPTFTLAPPPAVPAPVVAPTPARGSQTILPVPPSPEAPTNADYDQPFEEVKKILKATTPKPNPSTTAATVPQQVQQVQGGHVQQLGVQPQGAQGFQQVPAGGVGQPQAAVDPIMEQQRQLYYQQYNQYIRNYNEWQRQQQLVTPHPLFGNNIQQPGFQALQQTQQGGQPQQVFPGQPQVQGVQPQTLSGQPQVQGVQAQGVQQQSFPTQPQGVPVPQGVQPQQTFQRQVQVQGVQPQQNFQGQAQVQGVQTQQFPAVQQQTFPGGVQPQQAFNVQPQAQGAPTQGVQQQLPTQQVQGPFLLFNQPQPQQLPTFEQHQQQFQTVPNQGVQQQQLPQQGVQQIVRQQVQPQPVQQRQVEPIPQVPAPAQLTSVNNTPAPVPQSVQLNQIGSAVTDVPIRPTSVIKMENVDQSGVSSPNRAAIWFKENVDLTKCRAELGSIADKFKTKFPSYLQKGGKDAKLAELVGERLQECDKKSSAGHWDKVDGLLTKINLSKSEESECRAGLIQERISCVNLLNFACQFISPNYPFRLVPARITIQEARQAENGAEKCRKVVRLVKKRLEG